MCIVNSEICPICQWESDAKGDGEHTHRVNEDNLRPYFWSLEGSSHSLTQVFANLQSMTNGNTVVSHRLMYQGSSCINRYFYQQNSKLVATCTFLRLISEVPSHQKELEGAAEQTLEQKMCGLCSGKYTLRCHGCTDIT